MCFRDFSLNIGFKNFSMNSIFIWFVLLSICWFAVHILKIGASVFLFFSQEEIWRWKNWWSPVFEKSPFVSGGPKKSQKMLQKLGFHGFDKNIIHSYVPFYLSMKVLMVLNIFQNCLIKKFKFFGNFRFKEYLEMTSTKWLHILVYYEFYRSWCIE